MVRRSREIIYPAMLYGHKRKTFDCTFSCLGQGPYIIHCSNLANCKFILVLELKLPAVSTDRDFQRLGSGSPQTGPA